jgi:RNA polymerase sigma-70 factor, ECF subfamily
VGGSDVVRLRACSRPAKSGASLRSRGAPVEISERANPVLLLAAGDGAHLRCPRAIQAHHIAAERGSTQHGATRGDLPCSGAPWPPGMDSGHCGVMYVMETPASPMPARLLTDRAAFEAAVSPHYDHLVRRLLLIVRDTEEARDLAQTALMRAYEHRDRFEGGDVRAWLFTIGIRLALNEMRRRTRWQDWLRRTGSPATWAIQVDPDLWGALERLDRRHRAALILSTVDGYTHAEIGAALEVPTGTVASWVSRAKSALRSELQGGIDNE